MCRWYIWRYGRYISQDIQEAEERDRRYISHSSASYRLSLASSV